jgi:hypothetical protein
MANRLNRSVKVAIAKQLSNDKELQLKTRQIIEKQFRTAHQKLMNDFESHAVTRELRAGSGGSNVSGTLPEGNLFGFIGFTSGTDPVDAIEKLLSKTDIIIRRRKMGSFGFVWTYLVTSPSMQDLYGITPLPWANGSSWLRELEGRGIPNLGQYMHKRINSSRSGAGFQNRNRPEGGRVRIPYIKQLLQQFELNLNTIQASRVSKKYF